ncbi:MAG TPA: hypothetical protein VKU19_13665 [Bryobacteraceae bacterium]|nr:hypothetical protein [Bryobacteraceae bacterium]
MGGPETACAALVTQTRAARKMEIGRAKQYLISPKTNSQIWPVVGQRRRLQFRYKKRERIIEPHENGIHKGITERFRTFLI